MCKGRAEKGKVSVGKHDESKKQQQCRQICGAEVCQVEISIRKMCEIGDIESQGDYLADGETDHQETMMWANNRAIDVEVQDAKKDCSPDRSGSGDKKRRPVM